MTGIDNKAVMIALFIIITVLTISIFGMTILEKAFEVSGIKTRSTDDMKAEAACTYVKKGLGVVYYKHEGKAMALDTFVRNMLVSSKCFDADAQRAISAGGGPKVSAVAACPNSDAAGLNAYLLGPSETQYLMSGKSYIVQFTSVGAGEYPDVCVTLEVVS